MNVSLTARLEAFVKSRVDSGLYRSASEVVREALRGMEERSELQAAKLEALANDVSAGLAELDSGRGIPLDVDAVKAEGRRILKRQSIASD